MDVWDYFMMGSILLFIGSVCLSGVLGWAWKRFRPSLREVRLDWREFRASRRMARKRAEYTLWKTEAGQFIAQKRNFS